MANPQSAVTQPMPQGLSKTLKDVEELKRKKKLVQDDLNALKFEEKELGLKLSFMRKQVLNFDPAKEKIKMQAELKAANKELEKVRTHLKAAREELRRVKMESKKMMTTLDDKNVYLNDHYGEGVTSTLVGKIEGDRFVWNKSYVEMNDLEPIELKEESKQ